MPGTYVYVALGGVSVHELYAVTGLPFATGSTTDLPANPFFLAGGYVTESDGTVAAYNTYNNTLTGASVRIPLAAIVSSATDDGVRLTVVSGRLRLAAEGWIPGGLEAIHRGCPALPPPG
jgi:hypothetical protein